METNTVETRIARMLSKLNELHLLKHPFYQAWMNGDLSKETLQDYAKQYFYHVDYFPRYLSSLHARCELQEVRSQILEHLMEEEGVGFEASHPELWLRFAEGLGVSREDVTASQARTAIKNVVQSFLQNIEDSTAAGLGAILAYEAQVPEIAESKIEGLRKNYGVCDERTLGFFEVHRKADVKHREDMLRMIGEFSEKDLEKTERAALTVAQSLWNFLSDVYDRELREKASRLASSAPSEIACH